MLDTPPAPERVHPRERARGECAECLLLARCDVAKDTDVLREAVLARADDHRGQLRLELLVAPLRVLRAPWRSSSCPRAETVRCERDREVVESNVLGFGPESLVLHRLVTIKKVERDVCEGVKRELFMSVAA